MAQHQAHESDSLPVHCSQKFQQRKTSFVLELLELLGVGGIPNLPEPCSHYPCNAGILSFPVGEGPRLQPLRCRSQELSGICFKNTTSEVKH